jgi:hypothetical protein
MWTHNNAEKTVRYIMYKYLPRCEIKFGDKVGYLTRMESMAET